MSSDVIKYTGTLQICARQVACIEAAIHSINTMYEYMNTFAILLVDAKNVFNSLNRQSFLHDISCLCPSLVMFVKNCYSTLSILFIAGGTDVTSKKGTTQGDTVSMTIYGIEVTSLINMLIGNMSNEYSDNVNVKAYADDFSPGGNLQDLRRWWSVLTETGQKSDYHTRPTKS